MSKSVQTSEIKRLEETLAEVNRDLAKKQREFGNAAALRWRKRMSYSITSLNELSYGR